MPQQQKAKGEENSKFQRIALNLQYEGASFCGWQRQLQGLSVQGVLEDAIAELDPYRPINVVAAGRTDAGVHAAGQVAHFDCCGPIPVYRWANALNGRLPQSIRVLDAISRPANWHACYSATYRRYRYTIYNARRPNLFLEPWTWHKYNYRLDEALMKQALEGLLGHHDFSAFQRAGSNRPNAFTTVQDIHLERNGDLLGIEIQATGFLYGMVRLLIGQLVALGEHKFSLSTFERRWKEKRRTEVKESGPAKGLCLLRAGYEDPIFAQIASFDSFPKYELSRSDPPIDPPPIPL